MRHSKLRGGICSLDREEDSSEQAVSGRSAAPVMAKREAIGNLWCDSASTGSTRRDVTKLEGEGEGGINCSCRAGVEILARQLSHLRMRGPTVLGIRQLGPLVRLAREKRFRVGLVEYGEQEREGGESAVQQ
jgi:hypothetical protein